MPFPNEHAARLRAPGDFDRFRRVNGGTIRGNIEVPNTISVIWGHLKGKGPKAWAVQTLRFPTKNWTKEKAREWLTEHKLKPMLFEAASKPKKKKNVAKAHALIHKMATEDEEVLDLIGVDGHRVMDLHEALVDEMAEHGLAHGSVLLKAREKDPLFDLNSIIEHVFDEDVQEYCELQEEEEDADDGRVTFEFPIAKVDKEERMVYGIVLEPNEVDAQKDWVSPEEVRKAAHYFMENVQKIGVQHNDFTNNFKIMESYIAPSAFTLGTQKVKKGTWLLAVRVISDAIWKKVKKGEITGFSVGGTGTRIRRKAQ